MQKLIGIRGHRGAGKESVAFLLASTLDLFVSMPDEPEENLKEFFDKTYVDAVKKLLKDKDKAFQEACFNYIYLDAFGDAPKAMVQQLLGCDSKYIWDEYWKDHATVDLQTFDVEEVDELPDGLIIADNLMYGYGIGKMSIREFILYFGIVVMQQFFGQDVWVKSTAQNDKRNEEFFEDGIRIYSDVKAPTELSYLIDRQAVIINVERKGYKKNGGLDLLKDDKRWDYNIQIKGNDLMSIKDEIYKIAKDIYGENSEI